MKKDWKANLRNKQISAPMIILPVILTIIMPIFILVGVLYAPEEYINGFGGEEYLRSTLNAPSHYNKYLFAADITAKILILPYFLFVPSMITIVLSSDSFAGEKDKKTIESLALLPVSKAELIVGKVIAAFIPAMVLSGIFFIIQGVIINLMLFPHLEGNILIFFDLIWLLTILLLTPTMAFFNILIGIIISSRCKDFKSAQSINGSLISPVMILMFAQIINPEFLSPIMILIVSSLLFLLDLLFLRIGRKLLNIEKLILML
ncbi:MAG: ABC transporter permease subunit [Promethearchaeota archaeon]